MKKTIKATMICSTLLFGAVFLAGAAEVKTGTDKAGVSLYGQVDRVVLHVDDGEKSDTFSADNDHSSTRIGFNAKAEKDALTAGAKIEVEIESDSTASLSMHGDASNQGGDTFTERHMNVFLEHETFGKITLGQGDTASNGTAEVDLSGTAVAGYSDVEVMAASFLFYDNDAEDYSAVKVGDAYNNLDGLSRKDMIRYDSPSFSGFSLAVSTVSQDGDDADDVALRYSGKIGETQLAAEASYVKYQASDESKDNQYSGSISVLLPFGLNFTAAYGSLQHDDDDRDDAAMLYGKIGYIVKIFDAGSTAFAIDYSSHDNIKQNEDTATAMGLQVVQKLSDWSTELFASVRSYSLDREDTDFEDVLAAMAGARVKF